MKIIIRKGYPLYGSTGYFDPFTRKITIHGGLDKFPELKKFVIRHEKQHAKDFPNFLKMLKADAKDYFVIIRNPLFRKQLKELHKRPKLSLSLKNGLQFILYQIAIIPLLFIYQQISMFYRLKDRMKEGKHEK